MKSKSTPVNQIFKRKEEMKIDKLTIIINNITSSINNIIIINGNKRSSASLSLALAKRTKQNAAMNMIG